MANVLSEIVVDCRDAGAQAAWWSRVLDWPAVEDSGYWWISSDGTEDAALTICFIPVPEGKTVKNRVHLDVSPSGCEQAEELERLLSLGAPQGYRSGPGCLVVRVGGPGGQRVLPAADQEGLNTRSAVARQQRGR